MSASHRLLWLLICAAILLSASPVLAGGADDVVDTSTKAGTPANMKRGLLVSQAQFVKNDEGKIRPGPARLEVITREGGQWRTQVIEDSDSNVFHKAFVYRPKGSKPGIVTLGAMGAKVKIWRKKGGSFRSETMWSASFGGKWNRMRDAEIVRIGGRDLLAVATHDQGVVALVSPKGKGFTSRELDREANTFVHEIEVGDMDGDGNVEIYATPSEPNKLAKSVQKGVVVRYEAPDFKREVVADLGDRHAKEILVEDVDGDGKDELYVAVEAKTHKEGRKTIIDEPVEIRRYDRGSNPTKGKLVTTLDDRFTRFLTAGDVDGDGKKELVVAAFRSGLWLLSRRGKRWEKSSIDRKSSGFEHASILTDLDGDGKDELYVASDTQGELRRYTWNGSGFDKEVIQRREDKRSRITWNLMPVDLSLVK